MPFSPKLYIDLCSDPENPSFQLTLSFLVLTIVGRTENFSTLFSDSFQTNLVEAIDS